MPYLTTWRGKNSMGWVRNPQWLSMPTLSTESFVGLLAITNNDSNYIAIKCSGNYTVDWGDGTGTHNYTTATAAQNFYNFSTFDSSNLTLTSLGYKQALVIVTPQAGQSLTSINFQVKHTTLATSGVYCPTWLELAFYTPNCTSLTIGGNTLTLSWLQRVNIISIGAVTNFTSLFYNCTSLQSVPLFNTAASGSFTNMFYNCYSLQSVPLFNTGAGSLFQTMFYNCYSLQAVPLFNTSLGTNFISMFSGCLSLQSVPLFNTASGTNFTSMFQGCSSLLSVPLFNTIIGTNFSNMFYGCTLLQSVPTFNTVAGITFTGMFSSCVSLTAIPPLNVAAGTTFTTMFSGCYSLSSGALSGPTYSLTLTNGKFSEAGLVAIFTALGTASGAQTITVSTGNFGYASLTAGDRLIATSKGWTIA